MTDESRDDIRALRDGGMPVSVIAEVLRVDRRTIYELLDDPAAAHPCRERAADILAALESGSDHPMRDVMRLREQRPSGGGENLREMLSREVVDPAAVAARLAELDATISRYARYASERRVRPESGRGNPILDEMGWTSLSAP